MPTQKKIAPAAIVAAGLLLLMVVVMCLPFYTRYVSYSTREYSYYYGWYDSYDYYYSDYNFFEALEISFDYADRFGSICIISAFFTYLGAQAFSIISIFKRKAAVGSIICSAIAANMTLIGVFDLPGFDAPMPGWILMFLMLVAVMILSIVVASKKVTAPAAAAVPGAVCPTCRNVLPAGAIACNVCGTMLMTAAPVAPAATSFCAGCGAPLEPGKPFCSRCGRPVG